ncbi:peptidoglycan-binding domain-containing protein [Rhodococcus rhodochrous]|uniref:peptidoglycan-binding domain-containing protein n=1 Tax=Rhodococcus rhodochrous TaxID=1829 RepID=UPI001786CB6E|nr:peptidoglycan-binding domain-containing protein [Rhodococcus rhodochrous]QOH59879.1 hypothetical protein C6Y44_27705 [Rhodococcus rhodochrous]
MTILRANVDYAWNIVRARDRKPYGYGGTWSKTDVNRTTDCSGIVTHVLDALLNGPNMKWSRHGLSTEAYRYVGGAGAIGPFGTIRCTSPDQVPADAVLKIGLMHGPGGGANSHMSCTLEGVAIESRGMAFGEGGQIVGRTARHWNNALFHDWFYLPGKVVGEVDPNVFPMPADYFYGWYEGPEQSISGRAGEPKSWIDGLARMQERLGVPVSRVYDAATHNAVKQVQAATPGLLPDGFIGPRTWAAILEKGTEVAFTDEDRRMLREVHRELTQRHPSRSKYRDSGDKPIDTMAGFAINADARAHEALTEVRNLAKRFELATAKPKPTAQVSE